MEDHRSTDGGDAQSREQPSPATAGVMFWLLIALAGATFAPCVALPIWREYEATALAKQIEEQHNSAMRADVQRQRRTLDALRSDPGVATRLALRELSYERPGEEQVDVPGAMLATMPARSNPVTLTAVDPPRPIARLLGRLPVLDYDGLFCRGPTRTVLMLLSGALVVTAFLLFPPAVQRQDGQVAEEGVNAD